MRPAIIKVNKPTVKRFVEVRTRAVPREKNIMTMLSQLMHKRLHLKRTKGDNLKSQRKLPFKGRPTLCHTSRTGLKQYSKNTNSQERVIKDSKCP